MVDIIDPDKKKIERREVIRLLPAVNQTETLQKFFGATVNHLFQPGQSKSVNGHIGQKPWYFNADEDFYVKEEFKDRQFYQLEPAAVSADKATGDITNLLTYPDIINYLRFNGGLVNNHDRLFEQEYYSWCPPVNLDMLINFREYYWIKEGPDVKEVVPQNTYKADGNTKRFKLPMTRQASDDVEDVTVWINGVKKTHILDYVLTTTEVNFLRTPPANSEIKIRVYKEISVDDIEGNETWKSDDVIVGSTILPGLTLSCGMKIRLHNKNVGTPPSYTYTDYIVEGVGRSIQLIPDNTSASVELIPYIMYAGTGLETTYALPSGDIQGGPAGILVRVDNKDLTHDLHYKIEDRNIVFFKSYVPEEKAKIEIWLLREINLDEILGQQTYTSPDFQDGIVSGVTLVNGMKVRIIGDRTTVYSSQYSEEYVQQTFLNKQFFVKGVGEYIELEPDTSFQNDLDFKDYMVMERGDRVGNAWSTGNRWFHRNVIDFSKLDNTIVPMQAKRPIIEFEKNLELYRYGRYRRAAVATVLTQLKDQLGQIIPVTVVNGSSTNEYELVDNIFQRIHGKDEANINGVDLKTGMRILVTTDSDPLVNNRIFLVSRGTNGKIRLTMETDGAGEAAAPIMGEIVKVTHGVLAGKEFYWNGGAWTEAQQKKTVNQAPLFALYDTELNPLDDVGIYPVSNFAGNALFGYQLSTNTKKRKDPELGRRLVFGATGKSSEIVFENFLYTLDINGTLPEIKNNSAHPLDADGFATRYTYHDSESDSRKPIIGYYFHRKLGENEETDFYSNDWYKTDKVSKQFVLDTYVATGRETTIELSMLPTSADDIIVTRNGIQLLRGQYTLAGKTLSIANSEEGDFFEVKVWNIRPEESNGFYMIPTNLQANPDNREITTLTRGGFFAQFADIIQNQVGFDGKLYSSNNYRDTARKKNFGMQILQHSSPMLKTMIMASNQDIDFMYAARYVEREYTRMRNKIVQKAEEFLRKGIMDPYSESPSKWLDEILKVVNLGKTNDFPFNNSGMVEVEGGDPTYIPPTPSFLGFYPVYKPTVYVDDTYLQPKTVLRCHDGSVMLAYEDMRDHVMLELENRIYASINERFRGENRPLFDIQPYVAGKFRKVKQASWTHNANYTVGTQVYYLEKHFYCAVAYNVTQNLNTFDEQFAAGHWKQIARADYSREEFVEIYKPIFERWASFNRVDPRINQQYDPQNPWTWNWTKAIDMDGESLPGNWRGIYVHYFDTDMPHLTPWEMLGFTSKPEWWDARYGVAPYTRGNTLLWEDLENGFIAEGPRAGYDPTYSRPGLNKFIPVSDTGDLLDPVAAGIVHTSKIPSYQDASLPWEAGDIGPMENVWRRSEQFPFAMAQVSFLMKPARFVELGWEPVKIGRLSFNDQIINTDTQNRSNHGSLIVHNELDSDYNAVRKFGIQQWLSDWVKSRGQDVTTKFGAIIRGLNTRLVYKVAGFTTLDNLMAIADNYEHIPQEDMQLRLYRSPSIREEFYGGVIIQWTGRGWKVFGYDVLNPSFNILPGDVDGPATSFTIGGSGEKDIPTWKANTSYTTGFKVVYQDQVYRCRQTHLSERFFNYTLWDLATASHSNPGIKIVEFTRTTGEVQTIPYGYEFYTQQDVYNFLLGYQRYLERQGWMFDEVNANGEPQDFRKYGMDFLYWTMMNTATGTFIALSPVSQNVQFQCEHGTVQNIEQIINGVYSILNKEGYPINVKNTTVSRYHDKLNIRPVGDDSIYAVRLYVSEIEHVLIFNNKTIFNDTVYDPVLNLRQPRLRIQAYKTMDWKGRMDAPGFFISDNVIVPNFEKSAENFRNLFELDRFDDPTMQAYARHNFGYQRRSYLDNMLLSPTTQFDFYQGMIRQKGSSNAMSKILRSNRVSGGADVRFMEEWAFRIGDFGARDTRPSLELLLRQKQIRNNPQLIQFTNEAGFENKDEPFDDVITIYANDQRWMHKPVDIDMSKDNIQVFENRPLNKVYRNDLRTAGPVKIGETDYTFTNVFELALHMADETNEVKLGDFVWLYDGIGNRFDVLRYAETELTLERFSLNNNSSLSVVSDDSRKQLIINDGQMSGLPIGIYTLSEPKLESYVFERSYGYQDVEPELITYAKSIDVIKDIRGDNTSPSFATPSSGTNFAAPGIFKKVLLTSEQLKGAAFVKEIRLSTIEYSGDNFRGIWDVTHKGDDSISTALITSEFGSEYASDFAYALPANNTSNGLVYVYINGVKLPENSYIVSPSGDYVLISKLFTGTGTIQYRNINATDSIKVEVLSNPRIAIGTATNMQRFVRFASTPNIIDPMGVSVAYMMPYHLSINENFEPDFSEDICLFIDHDCATQGKLYVEMDVIFVAGSTQQQLIEFPENSEGYVSQIEVDVIEPFSTTNIFGNNQLYVGDTSFNGLERFVGPTNFPPSALTTSGSKNIAFNSTLPRDYVTGESLYINFVQAWSSSMIAALGYKEGESSNTAQFDYLTTDNEYFRTTPNTYHPALGGIKVLKNGLTVPVYDPTVASTDLRYNLIQNADYTTSVYFGERIQQRDSSGNVVRFDVTDTSSSSRVYSLPGAPKVVLSSNPSNATIVPLIGGGSVVEIVLENGGGNYMENYTVVDIIGNGVGATARPVVVDGVIQMIILDNHGSNFTKAPAIIIRDTSPRAGTERGYGAVAYARISEDGIAGYVIGNSSNVATVPELSIVPNGSGLGASARAVIRSDVGTISVTNGGTGYVTPPAVSISGVDGSGASAQAVIDVNGSLIGVVITNPGHGYVTPPTITFTAAPEEDGTTATAQAIVNAFGQVVAVQITNVGYAYDVAPTITFNNAGTGGPTISATAVLTNGSVTSIVPASGTVFGGEYLFEAGPSTTNPIAGAIVTIAGGATAVVGTIKPATITGVRVTATGSEYSGKLSEADILEIRIAEFDATGTQLSEWEQLTESPSLNEGYHISNNMIYFLKAPRFTPSISTRKVMMEIIQHHAVLVPRTEDIDIVSENTEIIPASDGLMNVRVHYTLKTSELEFVSTLDGNEIVDPFITVPNEDMTVVVNTWQSVVFETSADLSAFTPYTPWVVGDMVWVMNYLNTNRWAALIRNATNGWDVVRTQTDRVDVSKFKNAIVYNKRKNTIEARLQMYDPAKGYIPGIADSEIWYRLDYDPAYYTTGVDSRDQIDPNQAWGSEQVGRVWWDTSTTIFLDYELGNETEQDYLTYRWKYWGQIAPGTSIDLYEWIASPVHPLQWEKYVEKADKKNGSYYPSGTVKNADNPSWVEEKRYNASTGLEETTYYFWIKNSTTKPNVEHRFLNLTQIKHTMLDPTSSNLSWFAAIDQRTIMVGGVRAMLDDNDTILQVNWNIGDSQMNHHKQWILLREGDERSRIPTAMWHKMRDSLVGWDDGIDAPNDFEAEEGTLGEVFRSKRNSTPVGSPFGPRVVPEQELSSVEMMGIQFRPRQTMFNPYLEVRDGRKFFRPSMKARKHLIQSLNRTFYNDMVFFDLDSPPFAVSSPYPQGRTFEHYIDNAGEYEFILPRDFNMEDGSVFVYDLDGNVQTRDLFTGGQFTSGIHYKVEKVKVNGNFYNKIVFPKSVVPSQQDPIRYSTLFVTSREYYEHTVVDFVERDELLFSGNFVKGMKVLVTSSVETGGFWTLWRCQVDPSDLNPDEPVPASAWKLLEVQTYNLRDFVEEIDWWEEGYGPTTPITSFYDTTAHRNSALPTPSSGDVVKIYDDGYGKWMVTVWTGTTWHVVGRERYVKRFTSKFYDPSRTIYAGPGYTWYDKPYEEIWKDIKNRDGSWELKVLLDNLNGRLANSGLDYILDIKQANQLFFSMLNFAHTEQNMIDWAFKTSFLYLGGYNEPLNAIPVQTADQTESLQSYVEEVKPYHVKLRDFVRRLSPPVDTGRFYVTDFDKPPYYDRDLAAGLPSNDKSLAYRPLRVVPNGYGNYTVIEEDKNTLENGYWPVNVPTNESGKQYWHDWLYNFGKNPNQPQGLIADPMLIRRLKATIAFDRVDEYLEEELGNDQNSNPNNRRRTRVRAGWGGSTKVIGWDMVPWDMESDYVSSAGRLDANMVQYPGMPKNDPATLIPGIDYRGTVIEGYTFQYEQKQVEINSEPYFVVNTETGPVEMVPVVSTFTPTAYYGQGTPEYHVTKPANREAYKIVVYLYRQQSNSELNMFIVCGDFGIVEPSSSITVTIQGLPSNARIGHEDDTGDTYSLSNGTFTATWAWNHNNVDGVVLENIGDATTLRFTASNANNINEWKFVSSDGNYAYFPLSGTVSINKKTTRMWNEDNSDNYDLEIDGRQMDQIQISYDENRDEAKVFDIDIDGSEFINPLFAEGHPPELVKVRANDPFLMTVYQTYSPGSPMIYSQRTFGGYGYFQHPLFGGVWGPYKIGQDAQNIEAVVVHIDGVYQRLYEDYIVDVANREVWFIDHSPSGADGTVNPASDSNVVQITSFTVGGGTPYQVVEYEGDRQTSHFKIPNEGQQINKRLHVYMEKTNDLMVSHNGTTPWIIRNTTYNEKLYSVAFGVVNGNNVYVAVGEKTKGVVITSFKKTSNYATTATLTTTQEHNLRVGMKIIISGANPEVYNGEYTVESVINNKKFTISNPAWYNVAPPIGIITLESQARIISSNDTIFWNARLADAPDDLKKVAFGGRTDLTYNQRFVTVGKLGTILTSDDGETWTKRDSTVSVDLTDIAYIEDTKTWVALGQGSILKSTDNGATWTNTITQVKMTVGVNLPLTGQISAEDDLRSLVRPQFFTTIGAVPTADHTGLSMGAYMDLNYQDINGNPLDPKDDHPYLWEVDTISVVEPGWDGNVGDWNFTVVGGQGRSAKFRIHTSIQGTITSVTLTDRGSYSLKPYEMAFNVSGTALAELGIAPGTHLTVIGTKTNPTVTAGKKLKIGSTTMTFSSGADLVSVVETINRKTAKHNVIASIDANRLKLSIPTIWEVKPETEGSLPTGATFTLTFRPQGAGINMLESLLQNMLVWNDNDVVLLNGQTDTTHNGVYHFNRDGAGSPYEFTLSSRPSILYDMNDGMGYVKQGDGTYKQMFLNMNAMKFMNGMLFMVGARGTIIATPDLETWTIIDPADRYERDLKMIDALPESFMAIGDYGYVIKSQDGFNWTAAQQFTKLSLNDVCVFDEGKWVIVGEKGSIFRSNDDGKTWTQDDVTIKTDVLSTQFLNGSLINTFVGVKKLYKLNGPYDGITPPDYIIVGDEVVFDPTQAPLLPYGHKLRLVNLGTIIQGMKSFTTTAQSSAGTKPVYIVPGSPDGDTGSDIKKSIFITLEGEIKDSSFFEYTIEEDVKKNKETHITLNGDIDAGLDLVVTLFNGQDMCVVQTDAYPAVIKTGPSTNITYLNSGRTWTSGWAVGKLSQVPGSKFPREGTIIVKKNGIELMPPDYEFYTGDGETTNFPLSPPVNRSAKFEVYVNGVQKSVGMSINNHCYLVNDYDTNKVIEIAFYQAPAAGDDVVIVIYENHEYVVNYNATTDEARLVIVDKKPIDGTHTILSTGTFGFGLPSYANPEHYTIDVKVNNVVLPSDRYKFTHFVGLINGIEILKQADGTNGLAENDLLVITATPDPSVTIKDGDEFTVVSFREDAAMNINTELFNGATDSNFYILKKRPYNTDAVMVTVNGVEQIHMNDYRLTLLTLGGWDTFIWGGKEQYGQYRTWRMNPEYIEYLNSGGKPPVQPTIMENGRVVGSASVILEGTTLTTTVDEETAPGVAPLYYHPWTRNHQYQAGDVVYDVTSNHYYKCLFGHTSPNTFGRGSLSFSQVFNNWYRFTHMSGGALVPMRNTAPFAGELSAWSYNSTTDSIVSTTNSNTFIGFVSAEQLMDYEITAQMSSTNVDDDMIGMVIAMVTEGTPGQAGYREHTLSAIRSAGPGTPRWQIVYNYLQSTQQVIADGNAHMTVFGATPNNGVGWGGRQPGCKMKITRHGNIVTATSSELGTSVLDETSTLTVDLSSMPVLAKFTGLTRFGFCAFSQANSTWTSLVTNVNYWDRLTEYAGPTLYFNPSVDIKHGPDIEAYSWDSEYEGAVVEFDIAHTEADRIKVTTFGGTPYRPPFAWRVFRNGHEQWEGVRVADVHKTYLVQDLKVTNYTVSYEDYLADEKVDPILTSTKSKVDYEYQYGQVVCLRVNHNVPEKNIPHTVLPTPNKEANAPGVVWIKGERVEYYDITNTYKVYNVADITARDALTAATNEVARIGDAYYIFDGSSWNDIDESLVKKNYLRDEQGRRIIELRTLRRGSQGTSYGVPQKIEHMEITPNTKVEIDGAISTTIPGLNNFDVNPSYKEIFVWLDDVQMYTYQAWYDRFYPNFLDDDVVFYEVVNNKIVFKKETVVNGQRVIVEHDLVANQKVKVIGVLLDFKFTTTTHEVGSLVIDGSYQQKLPTFRPKTERKTGGLAHSNQEAARFLIAKPGSYY